MRCLSLCRSCCSFSIFEVLSCGNIFCFQMLSNTSSHLRHEDGLVRALSLRTKRPEYSVAFKTYFLRKLLPLVKAVMFVMAGSCKMYVWAKAVGLRSAFFSRSLIGFKLSVLTPLAMLVRGYGRGRVYRSWF